MFNSSDKAQKRIFKQNGSSIHFFRIFPFPPLWNAKTNALKCSIFFLLGKIVSTETKYFDFDDEKYLIHLEVNKKHYRFYLRAENIGTSNFVLFFVPINLT